jgi:hypothetical protein
MPGDMNIATKMGTWLANVKEAGSKIILSGENMGITTPTAINNPDMVSRKTEEFCM